MRKPLAILTISGVILSVSLVANVSSVRAQGLLRRLQDRVQGLEQQREGGQRPAGIAPSETDPRPGSERTNQRRPLVDALLQYGPEIFGGLENGGPVAGGAGLGRPVPVDGGASVANYEKASLGIDVLDSPPGVPGVLVAGFRKDSKADDAGLQKNDVIVSLDQTLTPKIADIASFLSQRRAGQTVTARVLRGDQMKTIRIPLLGPELPSPAVTPSDGNTVGGASTLSPQVPVPPAPMLPERDRSVQEVSSVEGQVELLPTPMNQAPVELAQNPGLERFGIFLGTGSRLRGALVEGVITGSAADLAGLKPADRVVSVNRLLTNDGAALIRQLESLPEGTRASLGVVRGDSYLIKVMTLTTEMKAVDPATGNQFGAASTQKVSGGNSPDAETGVLEGIGSMLGGLLGGAEKNNSQRPAESTPSARQKNLKTTEPVQQTAFEQKVSGQLKKILGDPPSLNDLKVRPKSDTTPKAAELGEQEQTAEQMREQIRQLQEKLRQIEQRSRTDSDSASQDAPVAKPE